MPHLCSALHPATMEDGHMVFETLCLLRHLEGMWNRMLILQWVIVIASYSITIQH